MAIRPSILDLKFDIRRMTPEDEKTGTGVFYGPNALLMRVTTPEGKLVADLVVVDRCIQTRRTMREFMRPENLPPAFAPIMDVVIVPEWRGIGLYPLMLMKMRDHIKAAGCDGLVSRAGGRVGEKSTASWEKFAKQSGGRVRVKQGRDGGLDYYLSGTFGGFSRGWRR